MPSSIGLLSEAIRTCLAEAARDGRREPHLERDEAEARAERVTIATSIRDTLPAFVFLPSALAAFRRDAPQALQEFGRTAPGTSWLILGPTSAGKTIAASLAFRRVLAVGVEQAGAAWELAAGARWYDASELARARRGWPLGQGDPPEFERAAGATILFLDDLGQERSDDGSLRDVLNERYSETRPTVVTTGLRMGELDARYDAQFVRRIIQGGTILDVFPKE